MVQGQDVQVKMGLGSIEESMDVLKKIAPLTLPHVRYKRGDGGDIHILHNPIPGVFEALCSDWRPDPKATGDCNALSALEDRNDAWCDDCRGIFSYRALSLLSELQE